MTTGPVGERDRVLSLDVLRGVAVLGILLMNIVAMGLPYYAYMDPNVAGGAEGLNFAAWATAEVLFEGTMRTIFSMLFGAGVVLMTLRGEARGDGIRVADLYYRRTILLIAMGAVHGYLLLWPGDILWMYGIAGLFLFPLRHWPARRLLTLGVTVILGYTLVMGSLDSLERYAAYDGAAEALAAQEAGDTLTEEQEASIEALVEWQEGFAPPQDVIDGMVEVRHRGYLGNVAGQAGDVFMVQTVETYTWGFWDAGGVMLIGMALLKLGVLTGERSTRFYLGLVALGYGLGVPLNVYEVSTIVSSDYARDAFVQAGWTYHFGRLLIAFGHIGLVMLVVRFAKAGALWPLAATGRMALTNYLMHSFIAMFIFCGFGAGLFGELQRAQLYIAVAAIWAFQLIASPLWLRSFRYGPTEWLWRSATYGVWQGLRREG